MKRQMSRHPRKGSEQPMELSGEWCSKEREHEVQRGRSGGMFDMFWDKRLVWQKQSWGVAGWAGLVGPLQGIGFHIPVKWVGIGELEQKNDMV